MLNHSNQTINNDFYMSKTSLTEGCVQFILVRKKFVSYDNMLTCHSLTHDNIFKFKSTDNTLPKDFIKSNTTSRFRSLSLLAYHRNRKRVLVVPCPNSKSNFST